MPIRYSDRGHPRLVVRLTVADIIASTGCTGPEAERFLEEFGDGIEQQMTEAAWEAVGTFRVMAGIGAPVRPPRRLPG